MKCERCNQPLPNWRLATGCCPHCGAKVQSHLLSDSVPPSENTKQEDQTQDVKPDQDQTIHSAISDPQHHDATVKLNADPPDHTDPQSEDSGDEPPALDKTVIEPPAAPIPATTIIRGDDEQTGGERTQFLQNPDQKSLGETTSDDESTKALSLNTRNFRQEAQHHSEHTDYEIQELLGEGGMGFVYRADQKSLSRSVAIKMVKSGEKQSSSAQQSFMSEAVVTGALEHPNIVPIYDMGTNEAGEHFYSMLHVRGTPWKEVIKSKSNRENIDILMSVADAMAFAHSRGVVHRDLKPENVMLGDFGEVWVMDWGLAFLTPESDRLQVVQNSNQLGCTPSYAAPELATGPAEKIGPASDIYLLGAILYEIVTGSPPHVGDTFSECLRNLVANEIAPTTKTGELVDIALKAMRTDPQNRYLSVIAFQDAIRTYLSHYESLAISSRASSELQQARKSQSYDLFSQVVFRFQEAVELWNGNQDAHEGLDEARIAFAECASKKGDLDLAESQLNPEDPGHQRLLSKIRRDRKIRDAREHKLRFARTLIRAAAAIFLVSATGAAVYMNSLKNEAVESANRAEEARAQASSMAELAQSERDIAKTATKEALSQKEQADTAKSAAESAEAQAVENEGIARTETRKAREQEYLARVALAAENIENNAFQDGFKLLEEYPNDEELSQLIDWEWYRMRFLSSRSVDDLVSDYGITNVAEINSVAVSPDGSFIFAGDQRGHILVWKSEDGPATAASESRFRKLQIPSLDSVNDLAASSTVLATCGTGNDILILAVSSLLEGEPEFIQLKAHSDTVTSVALHESQDRLILVSTSLDKSVRVWDITDVNASGLKNTDTKTLEEQSVRLDGHTWHVWDAAISPKGDMIVSVGQDGRAIVWELPSPGRRQSEIDFKPAGTFFEHRAPVSAVAIQPDRSGVRDSDRLLIATAGQDRTVRVWKRRDLELPKSELLVTFPGDQTIDAPLVNQRSVDDQAVSQPEDAASVKTATASRGFEDEILERRINGMADPPIPHLTLSGHEDAIRTLTFSPSGSLVLSGSDDNSLKVWHATTGRLEKTLRGHGRWVRACAFVPQGKLASGPQTKDRLIVLSGSYDRELKLWDVNSYRELEILRDPSLTHDRDGILSASFSRGGKNLIVTTSLDHSARLWNRHESNSPSTLLEGHEFLATSAVYVPDRPLIVTSSFDSTTRFWNKLTGGQIAILRGTGNEALAVVSPDGRWLVTGSDQTPEDDSTLQGAHLWSIDSVLESVQSSTEATPSAHLIGHSSRVTAAAFSSDGQWLFTADDNGRGLIWNPKTREIKLRINGHTDRIESAVFTRVGAAEQLITASADGTVARWNLTTGKEIDKSDESYLPATVRSLDASTDRGIAATLVSLKDDKSQAKSGIYIWDLKTGNRIRRITSDLPLTCIRFSPDGSTLFGGAIAATDRDHTLFRWNITEKFLSESKDRKTDRRDIYMDGRVLQGLVESVVVSKANDQLLVVGGNSARIFEYGVNGSEKSQPLQGPMMTFSPNGAVMDASFSSDDRFVVTAGDGRDGVIRVWSTETMRVIAKIPYAHRKDADNRTKITSVSFSPIKGSYQILSSGSDGQVLLWDWSPTDEEDVDRKRPQSKVLLSGQPNSPARCGVFSPDGSRIAAARNDRIYVWNVVDHKILEDSLCPQSLSGVESLAFDDASERLAGGGDSAIQIWNLETGEGLLSEPKGGHASQVTSVAFSPNGGQRIVSGSRDKTVKLWDIQEARSVGEFSDLREILTLRRHLDEVTDVEFSPEGDSILSSSLDGTAVLWLSDMLEGTASDQEQSEVARRAVK